MLHKVTGDPLLRCSQQPRTVKSLGVPRGWLTPVFIRRGDWLTQQHLRLLWMNLVLGDLAREEEVMESGHATSADVKVPHPIRPGF